ncbi:MAG: hypothetical protein II730_06940 [Bacteroidales bacterium]|nr:hypothetical protein [Bacteroidales bacterium]
MILLYASSTASAINFENFGKNGRLKLENFRKTQGINFEEDAVSKQLRPGQKVRHKELVRRLVGSVFTTGGKNISERTARNYISALSGTFLICNENGTYSLADPNLEIEYGRDRED